MASFGQESVLRLPCFRQKNRRTDSWTRNGYKTHYHKGMKIDQEVGTKCEVAYRRVYNLDKLWQNRKFKMILLKISQLSFLSFIPRPQSVIDSSNLQQKVIDLLFTSQVVGTRSSDWLDIYDYKTRGKHLRLPTRNF